MRYCPLLASRRLVELVQSISSSPSRPVIERHDLAAAPHLPIHLSHYLLRRCEMRCVSAHLCIAALPRILWIQMGQSTSCSHFLGETGGERQGLQA